MTLAAAPVSIDDAVRLLSACAWPAEAYWRIIELAEVRRHLPLPKPLLELGCGDGVFTSLVGLRVDHAIDLQANAVARAGALTDTYARVSQLDVHDAADSDLGRFRGIFSNSVLEHVPNLDPVLRACRELLLPGGTLLITVPLIDMNDHLAVRNPTYARFRQRQLQHHNLLGIEAWRLHLESAGFTDVQVSGYLSAASCRYWDRLDLVASFGIGRYRVGSAVHRVVSATVPDPQRNALKRMLARHLLDRARERGDRNCAALLIAQAPR